VKSAWRVGDNMSNITEPTEIFVPNYLELQEILLEHERAHWNADEADMRNDVEQWKNGKITDSEKAYIKMILRLFTQADTNVCASYAERLIPKFRNADARMMLLSFANREVTHMIGYKRLNDTLGYDSKSFMSEFLDFSEMKAKHEYMIEDADLSTEHGTATYLAKQILMEGVNLFGPFAMLLSFSGEGKIPGSTFVNQWSVADESLHVRGLVALLRIFLEENPQVVTDEFKAEVYQTYTKVIEFEDAFIDLVYSVGSNNNATADQVKQYVRYIGDYRMQQMGFKPQYRIKENPLPVVEQVTGNTLGNFFETTIVQYSKNSLSGDWVY
jgi:ribonucleoside-diphosphate reductase beta chain